MENEKLGLYFHIPFCIKKCSYCDFYSITDFELEKEYIDKILNEIDDFYIKNGKLSVDTIFFGGGTPSAISKKNIYRIMASVYDCFEVCDNSEISIELNPKTFDEKSLLVYKDAGINRVSMGLQSANDDELLALGRVHNFKEFLNSYYLLRELEFSNINIDIMFGLPNSNEKTLQKTLDEIKALKCEHISAYALTLSEKTPLYKMNYKYPSEDEIYEQYKLICQNLREYKHYEISNFAVKVCKHNLKYWTLKPYIGFGASAHSFFDGVRFSNVSDIYSYIKNCKKQYITSETKEDEIFELIMLSLRLDSGIDNEQIKALYNFDFIESYKDKLENFEKLGYMVKTKNGYALTEDGFFISNSIISSFL
jgi:oxygen-independent coproporphyrinogen-3 oxidase